MKLLDYAKVELIQKGLIKTTYKDGALVNVNHLEEIRRVYSDIAGTDDLKDIRLLVVFDGDIEMSRDVADRYLVADRHRTKVAEAFVVKTEAAKEYVNAATAILSGKHPIKVFENEETALNWLLSH